LKVKCGHVFALFMELVKKGSYFVRCIRLVREVTVSFYLKKCKNVRSYMLLSQFELHIYIYSDATFLRKKKNGVR
jgi:hypothetical protein